jgi:hypothetical protein
MRFSFALTPQARTCENDDGKGLLDLWWMRNNPNGLLATSTPNFFDKEMDSAIDIAHHKKQYPVYYETYQPPYERSQ